MSSTSPASGSSQHHPSRPGETLPSSWCQDHRQEGPARGPLPTEPLPAVAAACRRVKPPEPKGALSRDRTPGSRGLAASRSFSIPHLQLGKQPRAHPRAPADQGTWPHLGKAPKGLTLKRPHLLEVAGKESFAPQPPGLGFSPSYSFFSSSAWATPQIHKDPATPVSPLLAPTLPGSHPLPLTLNLGKNLLC